MQQVLDSLLWQIDSKGLIYKPGTGAGSQLTDFLNDMTGKIASGSVYGVSQSAIVAAMDASLSVEPAAAKTTIEHLGLVQRQVAAKIEAYRSRRAPDRVVNVFLGGDFMPVNVSGNTFNDSTVAIAEHIDNVGVAIQKSEASTDLKAALTALQEQVKQLAPQLPDDQSKNDVAAATDQMATEAVKKDPVESTVRAAGEKLIAAGNKVQQFAEPISNAVKTVYALLKLVP